MGSRAGRLPDHIRDGRTSGSGPAMGAYFPIVITAQGIAAGETRVYQFKAPMDLRILQACITVDEESAGTGVVQIQHNAVDVVASVAFPADDTPTELTLVRSERDITDGLTISVTCTATGQPVNGLAIILTYFTRSHVMANEADD